MTLRSKIIRLAYENPELRGDLLPLVASDEWTYHNVTIEEGFDGSGKKQFVVQGERRAKGKRTQYINEKFDTRNEAESWIKHAMPGAKLKKAAGPSFLVERDGTRSPLGRLLGTIAQHSPAGFEVGRDEVEPLIKAGLISYRLHPRGGYRADITQKGRSALSHI